MSAEQVIPVGIEEQLKTAYLDYAMSVIVARALPDVRDGLKPVQRRILYVMHEMGLRSNAPYKKSARIVGEVLGKFHPHGDMAVYEALARMAQDFTMRYPLVEGQGNFGSVDGDPPAAMRYTEARLTAMAEELLADLEKETVEWVDNFDGTLREPVVLPGKAPQLLINGASGIAVGMATNIPPHNLAEVCDALVYLIDRWEERDEVTIEDLMRFIPGPDFPTGGLILGQEGIRAAYATGHGRLVVRAVTRIEELKGGRWRIVVTELPYQVNKAALIERIAELVREGRIDDIADLRDESDRHGLSIVIELKRGARPQTVLNQLLKFTPLQTTFGVQMLALVDGQPRVLSLKRILQLFVEHRIQVVTRRTQYDLEKAKARAHILEGLRIALQFLDEVIALIRNAPDAETAKVQLMGRFGLTEIQAQAILDMPLRRLAALERQRLEEEYQGLTARITDLEALLADPRKILGVIREELQSLKDKYADPRRTHILPEATAEFAVEDLIPDEPALVLLSHRGYVKRVPVTAYRPQGRGGRGVTGMTTDEDDAVAGVFACRTLDYLFFFTDQGRAYRIRAYEVPDADRAARGLPIVNLINLMEGERITAAVAVSPAWIEEAGGNGGDRYLVMATRQGKIKRVPLSEFLTTRSAGLVAIGLEEGDVLQDVCLSDGAGDLLLVTAQGQALRFEEAEVRPMGRTAAGVRGIRLEEGDFVVALDRFDPEGELLVVTARGFGKRTPLSQYPQKGRATGGVRTIADRLEEIGEIAAARVVRPEEDVVLLTANGMAIRIPVAEIPQAGRSARGSRLIALGESDRLASLARIRLEAS
ncbi:DNA gyrase subunit A [Thermoflexus sp.]|uniref:DNA gyrase subunit A n=5 Tax=Thermoflexus sp. TaxID=1969742 RepID=UPI0026296668|nr:DNA gyrase subunit A [Thermoflexus sp.]MCX7690466.1 DNA gyrase subunit A [Thermoflexus sp.]